ncbi:hypothetical protein Pmani_038778 [Petrolisthes manimaculis]|uniref:Uncharacterized protein n=1 Tax=Petrolisthes manimaculis TaxID=1843537 RepID=A0AAE1NEZ7_9EUCA|nr:hypothetical protein Pmani_038778 [Petrolisthes manimaculis]
MRDGWKEREVRDGLMEGEGKEMRDGLKERAVREMKDGLTEGEGKEMREGLMEGEGRKGARVDRRSSPYSRSLSSGSIFTCWRHLGPLLRPLLFPSVPPLGPSPRGRA